MDGGIFASNSTSKTYIQGGIIYGNTSINSSSFGYGGGVYVRGTVSGYSHTGGVIVGGDPYTAPNGITYDANIAATNGHALFDAKYGGTSNTTIIKP
jgi:hypothetical protein